MDLPTNKPQVTILKIKRIVGKSKKKNYCDDFTYNFIIEKNYNITVVKSPGLESEVRLGSASTCVTLTKSPNFSAPQFTLLEMGINNDSYSHVVFYMAMPLLNPS